MQVLYKLHCLKIIPLHKWTQVEHYELEHQSVGQKKSRILYSWNAVSWKIAILGCSSWRWKPLELPIVISINFLSTPEVSSLHLACEEDETIRGARCAFEWHARRWEVSNSSHHNKPILIKLPLSDNIGHAMKSPSSTYFQFLINPDELRAAAAL